MDQIRTSPKSTFGPGRKALPLDALFLILPHGLLLDTAGPAEAFRLANLHSAQRGLPAPFRLRFCGPEATPASSVGLPVGPLEPLPDSLDRPTWVLLVGQPTAKLGQPAAAFQKAVRWLAGPFAALLGDADSPHRLITICSGAILAARAGLLAQRRCTTHHELLETLKACEPQARVVENRVFLVDGPVASSAGVTAGIDLALHLVSEECGDAIASAVARDMVVYLRRSSRDPELSPFLAHRSHLHPTVHKVQDAVSTAPAEAWSMGAMAARGHVTERHLLRLFVEHTGVSPLDYLEAIRLERARQSIQRGESITQAAEHAGFNSDLQLRRAWRRRWGGSPKDARRA